MTSCPFLLIEVMTVTHVCHAEQSCQTILCARLNHKMHMVIHQTICKQLNIELLFVKI